jgi:hypothetical protein
MMTHTPCMLHCARPCRRQRLTPYISNDQNMIARFTSQDLCMYMQDAACGLPRATGQHGDHVRLSTFVAALTSAATALPVCAVGCPVAAAASEAGSPPAAATALSGPGAAPSAGAATGRRTGLRCACHSAAAASTCAGTTSGIQSQNPPRPQVSPHSSLQPSPSQAEARHTRPGAWISTIKYRPRSGHRSAGRRSAASRPSSSRRIWGV